MKGFIIYIINLVIIKKHLSIMNLSKQAEEEIYKEKNQNLITMLESISEDEKTEKQMALLAKDNELKELAVKQSRTYLFALVRIYSNHCSCGHTIFSSEKNPCNYS